MAKTIFDGTVAAGDNAFARIAAHEVDFIQVAVRCTNASADSDLNNLHIRVYDPAGVEQVGSVPLLYTGDTVLDGNTLTFMAQYDVRGLEWLEPTVTNAAGADRDVSLHVYLYG